MDHEAVCTTNLARVVSRTHKSCFVIVSDENCADMNMIHPWWWQSELAGNYAKQFELRDIFNGIARVKWIEKLVKMLRSCICIKKERRDSQNSSTSSCRSSEIERNAAASSNTSDERESRSFMKYLSSSICFRVIRSPRRGLSMTKVERGEWSEAFSKTFYRFRCSRWHGEEDKLKITDCDRR